MNQTGHSNQKSQARPMQIGRLLEENGLVTASQVEQALVYQKERGNRKLLGEVLVELGFVTEDQVAECLAQACGFPFVIVGPENCDPQVIDRLPKEFIEKQNVLPMFCINDTLTIALHEPSDVYLIEEIQQLFSGEVQMVVSTADAIKSMVRAGSPNANVFLIDDLVDESLARDLDIVDEPVNELVDMEEIAGQSPVVKMVNFLIFSAVDELASDIHIEPDEDSLRVRYRVDGRLYEKITPPSSMHAAIVSRIKIMASLDISERRAPQDGSIRVMLSGRPIDLRVSTMPGRFGEKVVIRIIDNSAMSPCLEKTGMGMQVLNDFKKTLNVSHGIFLVTGPTGSGKSTTLYGMLDEVRSDEVNISTVEDPVEYNMPGINQFQTNEKANFYFANALRAMLRQDPDVIMVGEIRDNETASIATQAALTGHQVFSSLHTNDAIGAVTRLMNIGVEPYLIAATLRSVLAQRLVRKICPSCKQVLTPSDTDRAMIEEAVGEFETLYKGEGCAGCRSTGYQGRVGLFELFTPSDAIRLLISQGKALQELKEAAMVEGFVSLRHDGMQKAKDGKTTLSEVLYAASA